MTGSAAAVVADGVGDESESAGDGFGREFPAVLVDFDEVAGASVGGLFAVVDTVEVAPDVVFEVGSSVAHEVEG